MKGFFQFSFGKKKRKRKFAPGEKGLLGACKTHLLHGRLVQLVQVQGVDSLFSPKYQILVWNDTR